MKKETEEEEEEEEEEEDVGHFGAPEADISGIYSGRCAKEKEEAAENIGARDEAETAGILCGKGVGEPRGCSQGHP